MMSYQYESPMMVKDLSECYFYHVMELPGVGTVGEQWDLRDTVEEYLGHSGFNGKRALDVGTASGFLTFEMEKRGAEVVSFELDTADHWDLVPYAKEGFDLSAELQKKQANLDALKKGYWYAHRALGSRAKVAYGNVYSIPHQLGKFDLVIFGSILLHLRDPFQALLSASRLTKEAIIVTDLFIEAELPIMQFMPRWDMLTPTDTWWRISERCMTRMLEVLGFPDIAISRADHRIIHHEFLKSVTCSTFVARRA